MLYSSFPLAIHFTYDSVYVSIPVSQFIPQSPLPHVHKSVLYVCISIPAVQIGSSVPFFSIPHISINTQYLLLSSWVGKQRIRTKNARHVAVRCCSHLGRCTLRGLRMRKYRTLTPDRGHTEQRIDFSEPRPLHLPIHRTALNSLT